MENGQLLRVKFIKTEVDLPKINEITWIESKGDTVIEVNKILYIGNKSILEKYTEEVMGRVFGNVEIKSPEKWLLDPRYFGYSDEYKALLFQAWDRIQSRHDA